MWVKTFDPYPWIFENVGERTNKVLTKDSLVKNSSKTTKLRTLPL